MASAVTVPSTRDLLKLAQAETRQATKDATQATAGAAAVDKPTNKGKQVAKDAVKKAFDVADQAETAAEKAAKLATEHRRFLEDLLTDAKKAAKVSGDIEVRTKGYLNTAQSELDDYNQGLETARNKASQAADAVRQKSVPQSMLDKLQRLKQDVTDLTQKRDEISKHAVLARNEIEEARTAFDQAKKAGDDTVRCKQSTLSTWWYGPTTTPAETDAAKKLAEATTKSQELDEALQKADQPLLEATQKKDDYEAEVKKKQKALKDAQTEAAKTKKTQDDLEGSVAAAATKVTDLQDRLAKAENINTKKRQELVEVIDLCKIADDAQTAAQAAANTRQKGLDVCLSLGLVKERLDADVESGAVFDGLSADQKKAIRIFNREGTFGAKARELAPLLNGLSEADFLTSMQAENTAVKTTKQTKKPGGGTQQMQKWEFADGTVVRYKPEGDDYSGGDATYSIEVKNDRNKPDQGPADVAFKVDPKGRAVPMKPANVNNPFPPGPNRGAYRDQTMNLGHRSLD